MPTLRVYNSLSKEEEDFIPTEPGKVRLYHCGPTVYQRQHIGNMRRFLFADFLRRSLEFLGYEVREVTNITDVGHLTQDEIDAGEDKIARAAAAAKKTPQDIAQEQTQLFFADIARLNIQPSHLYPRATAHITHMQRLITQLLETGHAYQTPSGVYFSVQSFPRYGQLSGNSLAALNAGHRIAVRDEKKNPADFALWVVDPQSLQRWDSPWGIGYPGWHIECSAMSQEYLGVPIDIHTGGEDNRFPHHENEIAQSEAASGQPFVRFWMHNRHLQINGQKLAKRSGEQITLDTLTERGFDPLALRALIFQHSYRTKIDFAWEALQQAQEQLHWLHSSINRLPADTTAPSAPPDATVITAMQAALADDLNTPRAWAVILEYIRQLNRQLDAGPLSAAAVAQARATINQLDRVVGLLSPPRTTATPVPDAIEQLVTAREAARVAKDFAMADQLRAQIAQSGYILEDTPQGPRITPQQ